MPDKPECTKDQVVRAAREAKGFTTVMAKMLGVTTRTILNYRKRWKEVDREITFQQNIITDVAKLKVYKRIQEDDWKAIRFHLEKGPDDEYADRKEHGIRDSREDRYRRMDDDELEGEIGRLTSILQEGPGDDADGGEQG